MNKRNIALAILLSLVFLNIHCSDKKKTVRDEEPNSGSDPKITLKIKYPPGKFVMVQDQDMDMDMTIVADGKTQKQPVKQKMQQWMSLDVSQPDKQGNTTIGMTFDRMRQEVKAGANNIVLDTNDKKAMASNPAAKALEGLLDANITMKMTADGKVLSVGGMDKMWNSMAKDDPQLAAQMKKQMGSEAITKLCTQAMQMSPKEPVGVGAVWYSDMKMPIPVIGEMNIETKYKIKSIEKTGAGQIATFTVHAIMTTDTAKEMKVGTASMEINSMDMDMNGKVRINVDTGLMIDSTMDMSGDFDMAISEGGKKMEMSAKIKGTQKMTITKK